MGDTQKTQAVIVKSVGSVSDQAMDALSQLDHLAPHISAQHFRDQVASGAMVMRQAEYEGEPVAWAPYFFEGGDMGREMVIAACAGRLPALAGSLISTVALDWDNIAELNGCTSIRFHTKRPGLLRRMAAMGYELGEVSFRKVL